MGHRIDPRLGKRLETEAGQVGGTMQSTHFLVLRIETSTCRSNRDDRRKSGYESGNKTQSSRGYTIEALALEDQSQAGSGRPSGLQPSHAPGQETVLGDAAEGSQEATS